MDADIFAIMHSMHNGLRRDVIPNVVPQRCKESLGLRTKRAITQTRMLEARLNLRCEMMITRRKLREQLRFGVLLCKYLRSLQLAARATLKRILERMRTMHR